MASQASRAQAQRLLEAAAWQIKLGEPDDQVRLEFEEWRAVPENANAWARLMVPWNLMGEHANDQKLVGVRQEALSFAKRTSARLNKAGPRHGLWATAVSAMVAITLASGFGYHWLQQPTDYISAFGERRVITLSDGSKVALDSDSEVTVRYTGTRRELHLLRGQARFDVAHDVERPFSVFARDQRVIATGTTFNIDITQSRVFVTLIEGHVVVVGEDMVPQVITASHPVAQRRAFTELRAGQQLVARPDEIPIVKTANISRVVAWTSGQLVFDNQSLSEVVAQVNRYTTTPIVITDDKAAALRISGSFNTGDVPGFLNIVTHYLPVQTATDEAGRITLGTK